MTAIIQLALEIRVYSMDFTKTSFVVSRCEEQQGNRQNLLYVARAAEFRASVRSSIVVGSPPQAATPARQRRNGGKPVIDWEAKEDKKVGMEQICHEHKVAYSRKK